MNIWDLGTSNCDGDVGEVDEYGVLGPLAVQVPCPILVEAAETRHCRNLSCNAMQTCAL